MSPHDIVQQLQAIASEHEQIAIAWHVAIAILAIALVRWEPSTRTAVVLTAMPAASVFLAAAGYRSWFNAISFAVLAIVLLGPRQLAPRWRTCVPAWSSLLGVALIMFGLWYPHFTDGGYRSLYASPIGLLPCPSLAVMAGFTLVAGGFGTRAIPAVLAVWTAFYGAFGAFVLGVDLDVGLLIAAFALARIALHNRGACNLALAPS